jgi:hypothetical protein
MGLFDIFKKKPKIVDELFGELNYTTFKDSLKKFYVGNVTLDSQQIRINLDGDENGPTKEQKDFFIKLRDNYTSFKTEILIPFLKKELQDWIEENQITDFDAEFKIDGLSLPRINSFPIKWTLTLYSIKIHHYLTIEFTDMKPEDGIAVDG